MLSYIISNNVSIEIFTYNNYNILSFPYFINTGFFLYREKTGKGHLAWGDFLWHSNDGIYSVYIADVTVSDVSFLWAGLANGIFGRNIKETTLDIAKENNAIFAINGDFYGRKNIS